MSLCRRVAPPERSYSVRVGTLEVRTPAATRLPVTRPLTATTGAGSARADAAPKMVREAPRNDRREGTYGRLGGAAEGKDRSAATHSGSQHA
jgi:hypothetical protein